MAIRWGVNDRAVEAARAAARLGLCAIIIDRYWRGEVRKPDTVRRRRNDLIESTGCMMAGKRGAAEVTDSGGEIRPIIKHLAISQSIARRAILIINIALNVLVTT